MQRFHQQPQRIFLSPGRINIIGEHVDYNNGYVLPAAIDKYVCVAISASAGTRCTLVAVDLNEEFEFDLSVDLVPVDQMWANYFLGVVQQIKQRQLPLQGFKLVFTSTIPIGAGLSSSAAVECGFGYAVNKMFDLGLTNKEIALIGQKAEHTFVGVQCGIMDQFASVFGKENHVIRLDCDTLEYDYHKADFQQYTLLLLDSNVKHSHATSGYNTRRQEVHQGLDIIKKHFPDVTSFRDCSVAQVESLRAYLGETVYKRCHFVVKEIQRVLDAVDALEQNDFIKLGALMFETHDGLSNEYEVSCDETDYLVTSARAFSVIGARMMGGGFGGCTINLVHKDHEQQLIDQLSDSYFKKFNIKLQSYKVKISDGTSEYQ